MTEWLELFGVLVTAFVAWQNGRIHKLVNSRYRELVDEVARLNKVIRDTESK